ncbi:hypothetical protein AAFF_G00363710 [Aldrovandia affinis]|uniref:non-specific serine/threonine protein kinase n=1 Tax=Aldrovandia affinis TaxID=143900 RepID=A0AAD7SHL9_9TELE|nr:hypothetical protein AAFF_G00363710 [Aldrovandia affinis]
MKTLLIQLPLVVMSLHCLFTLSPVMPTHRYRFMVMDRLGTDLQKVCGENRGRLKRPTVLRLGCLLLDILEYIHDNEYVHADIKAANLLLGHGDPSKVYLADYGLSYRYCPDGVHKEYKENPKKGHNGTIEYTSADAHNGVAPSRRGDLEVLGYCLLHWLCGRLPWDTALKKPAMVQEAKARLMAHLPDSVTELSPSGTSTVEVARFLLYTKSLGYKERPDYQKLRDILAEGRSKAARREGPLDLSRPMEEELGCGTPPYSKPMRAKPTAKETARRCEAAGTPDGAEPPSRAPVHQRAKTQPRPSPAQEEVKAKYAGDTHGRKGRLGHNQNERSEVRRPTTKTGGRRRRRRSPAKSHTRRRGSPQHTYSLRERPARRQDTPWGLKQWGGAFTILFFLILVVLLILGPQTSRRESMARL